jgi:hypothetical protein
MQRPMGWFRAKRGEITWLAFFALACQFALTFGHIHLGSFRSVPAAWAVSTGSANGSTGIRSSPEQKAPAGLAQDFCAVCNNISLANALILPASPTATPSVSIVSNLQWSVAPVVVAQGGHFHFSARGPPAPDLAT